MARIDISISLLSFNTKDFLEKCLHSIYKGSKNLNIEILLVDNASKDGTVQMVREKFPKVSLIANRTNRLYIRGHNQNLRRVRGKYFLILNEDTVLPPNTLGKMAEFMDKNPQVGLSGCRQIGDRGVLDKTCSNFPHPIDEILESTSFGKLLQKTFAGNQIRKRLRYYRIASWPRNTIRRVDVLPGSLILGRSKLLKEVGILDEKTLKFFYGEPDYCRRVKLTGYEIVHLGQVTIRHLKSKAFSKLPSFTRFNLARGDMLAFYKKYFGFFWWIVLYVLTLPDFAYWRLKNSN